MDVKFGISSIVLNGVCKEIQTRTIATNTEVQSCFHSCPAVIYCMPPMVYGSYPCCPQFYTLDKKCNCICNSQVQNCMVLPRQSCCVQSTGNFSQINSDCSSCLHSCETRKQEEIQQKSWRSEEKNMTESPSSKEDKVPEVTKCPSHGHRAKKDDELTPRELIKYANDFLESVPDFDEFISDEEGDGDKVSTQTSTTFEEKHYIKPEQPSRVFTKENENFVAKNTKENLNPIEKKPLNHMLRPSVGFSDEEEYGFDDETDKSNFNMESPNVATTRTLDVPKENTVPKTSVRNMSFMKPRAPDLPMMMMISSLVKEKSTNDGSKLNQLLNHIDKESHPKDKDIFKGLLSNKPPQPVETKRSTPKLLTTRSSLENLLKKS